MHGHESYKRIFTFLNKNLLEFSSFSAKDLSEFSKLKLSTIKVYIRNKLKNKFIIPSGVGLYKVNEEILKYTEDKFIAWMSQKSVKFVLNDTKLYDQLLDNSIQSILSAIEIHNKPQINYRYQVVVILIINSWELALKAYLLKYQSQTKIFKDDGTTKPFPECLNNVESTIGKSILPTTENIRLLYKYRCNYIHFFHENLDMLLFSLIQKSVIFYSKFLSIYFNKDISNVDDLYILPIGIKKPLSPLDFISNKSQIEKAPSYVKSFFNDIIEKTNSLYENKIEEMLFVPYSINLINVKRIKNADIIAAISQNSKISISIDENIIVSNNENAKEIKIKEETVFEDIYNLRFAEIVEFCKYNIPNFKRFLDVSCG